MIVPQYLRAFKVMAGLVILQACAISACNTTRRQGGSDLSAGPAVAGAAASASCTDATTNQVVPGVGYIGAGEADTGQGEFRVHWFNKKTREVCSGDIFKTFPISQEFNGVGLIVDGTTLTLAQDPDVNYGYLGRYLPCDAAIKLLGIDSSSIVDENGNAVTNLQVNQCEVRLDTEDRSWEALTVSTPWLKKTVGYDETADKKLQAVLASPELMVKAHELSDPHTRFVSVNQSVNPKVVDAMVAIHSKFEADRNGNVNSYAEQERNTCLRNARATSWLDLQAHFYCILPYNYRACYSTDLAAAAPAITREQNPIRALDMLDEVMKTTFEKCFGDQGSVSFKSAFGAQSQLVVDGFKYANFVRQGVMDFNLVEEVATIDEYYTRIGESRRSRLLDPQPFNANQARYAEVRKMQYGRLLARNCKATGGTFDPASGCTCAAGKNLDAQTGLCK